MRVALYARVSTNRVKCMDCRRTLPRFETFIPSKCDRCGGKHLDVGQQVETQLEPLRDWATRRNADAVEYVDIGISGVKEKRPQLNKLMFDAGHKKFDAVVVARFDRFARTTKHLVNALEEFKRLGIDFVSLNEAIDTSTPLGQMVFTIIGAVAQLERELIRERVIAGMMRIKSRCLICGKRFPARLIACPECDSPNIKTGKVIGRPVKVLDRLKVIMFHQKIGSLRKTAEQFGVSKDTIARLIASKVPVSKKDALHQGYERLDERKCKACRKLIVFYRRPPKGSGTSLLVVNEEDFTPHWTTCVETRTRVSKIEKIHESDAPPERSHRQWKEW